MIRKTLTFITLLIIALSQNMTQATEWYRYPVFCDKIDELVETPDKIYYLSGGNLYSFSPVDNESYAYTQLNKLTDASIKTIYYNRQKKYLLIVYNNSNLDILFDNGKVINMPEIKDSPIGTSKIINDVAFGEDRIAIATDFGIVIYNDNKFEVVESGIFNQEINCVGIMNGRLLIYGHYATDFTIMQSPLNMRHNSLDKFTPVFKFGLRSFVVINDNVLAFRENLSNKLYVRKVDLEQPSYANLLAGEYVYDYDFKPYKDGYYTLFEDKIVLLNDENITTQDIPESLRGEELAFFSDPTKVWTGSPEGVSCFDISTSTPTVLYDRMKFDNYTTATNIGYMNWSKDKKRLYISNMEISMARSYPLGEDSPNYQTTNVIEFGQVTDVSLKKASAAHSQTKKYQTRHHDKRMYGGPTWVIEDPDDNDKYYCGNYFEGIYVIKRNPTTGEYEEIGKFNAENSTIVDNWGPRVMFLEIDDEGNLWVGHQFGQCISVLPAEKRHQDPKTITAADWIPYSKLEELDYHGKDFFGLICKHSDMAFFSMGIYEKGFVAIDTKGTYTNHNDDMVHHWTELTDQDGNSLTYTYITCMLEDRRGSVWIGTNAGVFEITNPSKATDPTMRIRRIKVPRNDGTNYADYLLDSDFINWMALDPSGRKWIATQTSGMYLVSETGDKILYHFDATNSPLTTNAITSIECDKHDNTVYVGTVDGLYSFKGDSSPGQEDYSQIYAYPNPVRPEYSGLVTITGMMENSIVKITDAAGNVVFETRSEGGMALWDACNTNGERVNTGVYYVYASQTEGGTSTGAVTKILVIN